MLRNSMVRKLEILKMRGQPTLPGLHTLRIGAAGVTVFPPASVAMAPQVNSDAEAPRLLMGVPGLDDMLGGGLPQGYSHPNRSRSRIAADLIASGKLGLVENRAADHLIDEVVYIVSASACIQKTAMTPRR